MKKALSLFLITIMLSSVMIISPLAAAYYDTISGNMVAHGDFEIENVSNYFWMNPSDGPYRGGTCEWQAKGGVGNSACIRMNGTTGEQLLTCPGISYRDISNGLDAVKWLQVTQGKTYVASVDVYIPEGVTTTIRFDAENGRGLPYMQTSQCGQWVRLLKKFTADGTGDIYLRVFAPDKDLTESEYVLIDNFSIVEYNANTDYYHRIGQSSSYYKTLTGNLLEEGAFEAANISEYFWMESSDGPYRGGTCVWQADGGVGESACIRLNGIADRTAVPCLMIRNRVNQPMFGYVEAGKKYIAVVDIFRPEGVTANVQFDSENGRGMAYQRASKNGEWERLVSVFTADGTGDIPLRVFIPDKDLLEDQYILIDNMYLAEYDENTNYLEMEIVSDPSPSTSDSLLAASAVVSVVVLSGVCVFSKKKKHI